MANYAANDGSMKPPADGQGFDAYQAACERLFGEADSVQVPDGGDGLKQYFADTTAFLRLLTEYRMFMNSGEAAGAPLSEFQDWNERLFGDLKGGNYNRSWANPAWASAHLDARWAKELCFLYAQIRELTGCAAQNELKKLTIYLDLYLQVRDCFQENPGSGSPCRESGTPGQSAVSVHKMLYDFALDQCGYFASERVLDTIDPDRDFALKIIMGSDLSDPRFLYRYGEYISKTELEMAAFLAEADEEMISRMADTFTEGYRVGFVRAGKDLSIKKTVNIQYPLGFERVVRKAVENFSGMGLRPVIFRRALSYLNRRGTHRSGYSASPVNEQFDYDHREDCALFMGGEFASRRLEAIRAAYESHRDLARGMAGPAVIEMFGEEPFAPLDCPQCFRMTKGMRGVHAKMNTQTAQLANRYIVGRERSFTDIAFPNPAIGPDFPEIFRDVVQFNTLDNDRCIRVQQCLIDALDQGRYVHITGRGGNRTELTVALASLGNPQRETLFENCAADVNIPAGEVFTTPALEGTHGLLHVTDVYLNGMMYRDLTLTFRDGMVIDYGCGNFDDPKAGREYVLANVLANHETLPMGEFAIGTNTAAYAASVKYGISSKMPILIAEKMGPHFAVGDTCYSFEEDSPVYNPDGKEIIARDNSCSILRKTDPQKAYFGCHTDITIPYSQLGKVEVIREDGSRIPLLEDGFFVLEGTRQLNEPLFHMLSPMM